MLRRFLHQLAEITNYKSLIDCVPKVRRPGPRQTIAEPNEIASLLKHAKPWMKGLILLATHAGLRRSDCLRIAPVHYDDQRRVLSIEQKKTNHIVTVPVTDQLAAWLATVETQTIHSPFIESAAGRKIRGSNLGEHWIRLKRKAGVNPTLWIHDLRRTSAVTLYQLTKDLTAVEAFLGHASLSSTVGYLEHKDPGKLKPWLDQMWRPKTEVIQ